MVAGKKKKSKRTLTANNWRCAKDVLEISQNSEEKHCCNLYFNKIEDLQLNFVKFLRNT